MKILTTDKIKLDILFYFVLLIIGFIIMQYSPVFFNKFEPDSNSYINYDPVRTTLYPIIIDLLEKDNEKNFNNLIFFQTFFLLISIIFLIFSLKTLNVNFFFLILIFFLIFFNFYYTSFAKVILTEAIFFGFLNFSFGLLFLKKYLLESKTLCLLFGFFIGGVIAIKSIGILVALLLFFVLIKRDFYKNKKYILITLIGTTLLPVIENIIYYSKYEERKSVFSRSLTGKIFMLSGKKGFDPNIFNKKYQKFITIFSQESREVHLFLDKIENPFLIANLKADYETVGQYQFDAKINEFKSEYRLEDFEIFVGKLSIEVIKNYPFEYFKMILWHYLGLWSPGSKQLLLNDIISTSIPYQKMLETSSGKMLEINKSLMILVNLFFLILFLIFTIITFKSFYNFFFDSKNKNTIIDTLILICQIYLLAISMTNIATPRYFMPIFPIVLISVLWHINVFFNLSLTKKDNNVEIS